MAILKTIAVLAIACTAAASPASAAPGLTFGNYVNNFSYPNGRSFPYPYNYSPAPIPGPWQALNWTTWNAVFRRDPLTLDPHSPPVYAETLIPTGTPAGASNKTRTVGSFGAAYAGSRVISFDMSSTWVGCGAEATYVNSVQRGPAFCDLTFRGFKDDAGNIESARKTYQYREPIQLSRIGGPYAEMAQVNFTEPGWRGIRRVNVEAVLVPNPALGPYSSAPSIGIDDVAYGVTNATRS